MVDYARPAFTGSFWKAEPKVVDKLDKRKAAQRMDRHETKGRPRAVTTPKACLACGAAFERRARGESLVAFNHRVYCSRKCSDKAESEKWGNARAAVAAPCAHCGKATRPGKPSHATKFCSHRCSALASRKPRQLCVVCGVQPRQLSATTCSAACGYIWRKSKTRKPRQCNQCGTTYWPSTAIRLKFCSRKCADADRSKRPMFILAVCQGCNTTFRRTPAAVKRSKRVFCSQACFRLNNRDEQNHAFRGDKDPNRGAKWNRLAESIRARDSHTCRRCGVQQGKEKLSVDHVRPWRSFEDKALANHRDNLVSLCRSCHGHKTTTVEAAWLRGDVLAWKQWVASLNLPSASVGISA